MDIATLENRISLNLPIYCGDRCVEVSDIFTVFGLIEVSFVDGEKKFVVDIKTLSEKPSEEISISLSLLKKVNRYQINTCIGCKYFSCGVDWNNCDLLKMSNISEDGCVYVNEDESINWEKLKEDLEG